jgi:hypothetical protein
VTPLMAPPYTDPTRAHNVVVTAANAHDSPTPDQPLGNGMHGATDPPHTLVAVQRRESDGGAVQ